MVNDNIYRTVDIERRGFGRRYTWLPVDTLSRQEFTINCADAYVRPPMYDIQLGDIVRWREGERYIEGVVGDVQRDETTLVVQINEAKPLPPESFYP